MQAPDEEAGGVLPVLAGRWVRRPSLQEASGDAAERHPAWVLWTWYGKLPTKPVWEPGRELHR